MNAMPTTIKLPVAFTYTKFLVPINFGRLVSGDAKGQKPWRHPFTTIHAAIRTARVPAQPFVGANPQEEQNA